MRCSSTFHGGSFITDNTGAIVKQVTVPGKCTTFTGALIDRSPAGSGSTIRLGRLVVHF